MRIRLAGPFGILLLLSSLSLPVAQAEQPRVPVTAAQAAAAAGDPAAEIARAQAQITKSYEAMNGANPLSQDYSKISLAAAEGALGPLQKLLSQPAVKGYLKLFSSPVFSDGIDKILKSPERMNLVYAQIGLMLFMMVFRAWRMSKANHWAKKLWTHLWTLCLFWVCSLVIIPWIVLGNPYYEVVTGVIAVLTSGK